MDERSAPRSALWLRAAAAFVGLAVLAASGFALYDYTNEQGLLPGVVGSTREPRAVPELPFQDARGKPMSLADFRGKVVLLNVWATWCAPCRREMPALDRVQQQLGGPGFEVVALSIDRAGPAVVQRFYDEIGIRALSIYMDPSTEATARLKTIGIPTTLLIDREGRELWRKTGPAEWDAPKYLDTLRQQIGAAAPAASAR